MKNEKITKIIKIIETIKKYARSFQIFCELTQAGFYYSGSYHKNKATTNEKNPAKWAGHWGFYRFNYEKNGLVQNYIYDIDFDDPSYYHVHGGIKKDESLFRIQNGEINKTIKHQVKFYTEWGENEPDGDVWCQSEISA